MDKGRLLVALAIVAGGCGGDGGGDGGAGPGPLKPKLTITGGNQQVDTVGQMLPVPLSVILRDTLGNPIAGAAITWSVVSGNGNVTPNAAVTGADGVATASYTLGQLTTLNSVRANAAEAGAPVFFASNPVHDVIAQVIKVSGDSQYAEVGDAVQQPYRVRTADQYGNPVPGETVNWAVTSGGGSLSVASSVSNATGEATVIHTLGSTGLNATAATLAVVPGATVSFTGIGIIPAVLASEIFVPANYGVHDTFVRDGILIVCAWNTGIILYDVGNGIRGGSPTNPMEISRLVTSDNGVPGGPAAHNVWWFHNPVTSEKRYLFIGQEGPLYVGEQSSGDIHVVDLTDLTNPVEVASFRLPGSGAHNFWMDEAAQVLYAAFYDGGVVAIDVSGSLVGDISSRLIARVRPGGPGNTAVWGVQLHNGSIYATDMLSGFYQLKHAGFTFSVVGGGNNNRDYPAYNTDLWVHGTHAYTGTAGVRAPPLNIWRLDPNGEPVYINSVRPPNDLFSVSDLQVSPSGNLLMFSTEGGTNQGMYFYNLADPEHPAFVSRYLTAPGGTHTATVAEIGGRLYVFGSRNPPQPAVVIVDITTLDF